MSSSEPMEEIYVNVEHTKPVDPRPSINQTGPRSSKGGFHGVTVLFLALLSVFLLAGLIGFGVHYRNSERGSSAELSTIKDNLTELLQASNSKLSSALEERDQLNASLTETTKELNRLQSLSKQKRTCPAGWTMFSGSCYLLSTESGSWEKGRQDCRNSGADLVVIDSHEEQEFLTKTIKQHTWIGLSDRDNEGVWKWIDGTPLTLTIICRLLGDCTVNTSGRCFTSLVAWMFSGVPFMGTGRESSLIMVVDIQSGVERTAHISEARELKKTGMICGVMTLCNGSVKK